MAVPRSLSTTTARTSNNNNSKSPSHQQCSKFSCFLAGIFLASIVFWNESRGTTTSRLRQQASPLKERENKVTASHNTNLGDNIPRLIPIPASIQYTLRETSHLEFAKQTLHTDGIVPDVDMQFMTSAAKSRDSAFFAFSNYQIKFEGGVTNLWRMILNARATATTKYMVMDCGMNIGFYSTLSAVMGFDVNSMEVQLDCLDINNLLLERNDVTHRVHRYFMGVSDGVGVTNIKEGCDPGANVLDKTTAAAATPDKRSHQVGLVSLDLLLDQTRNDRQIAILKLDVEGMEIRALRGARSHLQAVENIIQEVAPQYLQKMGTTVPDIIAEFEYLQGMERFEPFLLYTWQVPRKQWTNTTFLALNGIEGMDRHPLDDKIKFDPDMVETLILWKIVDWDKLLANACKMGCNVWFRRPEV